MVHLTNSDFFPVWTITSCRFPNRVSSFRFNRLALLMHQSKSYQISQTLKGPPKHILSVLLINPKFQLLFFYVFNMHFQFLSSNNCSILMLASWLVHLLSFKFGWNSNSARNLYRYHLSFKFLLNKRDQYWFPLINFKPHISLELNLIMSVQKILFQIL